jgi:hypothetical protein
MTRQSAPIDISNMPELLKLVEGLGPDQEGRVLRRDGQDVAVLIPLRRRSTPPSKAKPVTADDPIFKLVGAGRSGIPGGISERKHEYLAEAKRQRR